MYMYIYIYTFLEVNTYIYRNITEHYSVSAFIVLLPS